MRPWRQLSAREAAEQTVGMSRLREKLITPSRPKGDEMKPMTPLPYGDPHNGQRWGVKR